MKPIHGALVAMMLMMTASPLAMGADLGAVSHTDARTLVFNYGPDQVYELTGTYGRVTTLFFGEDEKIEAVAVGDSEAWEVTPGKARNFVFLKPLLDEAETNLTVTTTRRAYALHLTAQKADGGAKAAPRPYLVRFAYPADPAPLAAEPMISPEALARVEARAEAAEEAARLAEAAAEERAKAEARRIAEETRRRRAAPMVVFDESSEVALKDAASRGGDVAVRIDAAFREDGLYNPARAVEIDRLDARLLQGAVIPGVLETAVNSDLPGMTRARIPEAVRSTDGSRVLIEAGSQLVGDYESNLGIGDARILIRWSRLITPDGVSLALDSPGGDPLGRSGNTGFVDTHLESRLGAALLVTLIGAAPGLVETQGGGEIAADAASASARTLQSSLVGQIARRPTVHLDQGTRVSVMAARDLDFSRLYAAAE